MQPFIYAARDSTLGKSDGLSEFGNSMGPAGHTALWRLRLGLRWRRMLESFPPRMGHQGYKRSGHGVLLEYEESEAGDVSPYSSAGKRLKNRRDQ